jgi:phage prohead protease, HK97 family
VLGNTKSGTLRLTNMETELRFELDIPNTSVGNDAWELIQRGDVDGVSFGMIVTKDKWSSEKRGDSRIYKRQILAAELYEISPVAFPAYPANEVAARSLEEFKASEKRAADQYEKEKMLLELDLYG